MKPQVWVEKEVEGEGAGEKLQYEEEWEERGDPGWRRRWRSSLLPTLRICIYQKVIVSL